MLIRISKESVCGEKVYVGRGGEKFNSALPIDADRAYATVISESNITNLVVAN